MLTQSILSPAKVAVDQMKLTFNGMYCDADVETLMQIGADDETVSDSCRLATQDDCEKSKNENENLTKSVTDEFNAVSKQKRKFFYYFSRRNFFFLATTMYTYRC